MAQKRYYWLKLSEDFFRQKDIKRLRQIAGGDTFTIVYLKLLLRSLENNGKLYYDGVESDFPSEMALDIDETVENVTMTVQFLIARGILQKNDGVEYEMLTAAEMTGSECDSARRVREHRRREVFASLLQSNSNVTKCNTEKDIELDTRDRDRPPKAPHGGAAFDRFWKAYPKKVGKQAALKAFQRVKVPLETLLTAIDRQKRGEQWSRDNGRYIPNPATWLNQGRWEDEVITAQGRDTVKTAADYDDGEAFISCST